MLVLGRDFVREHLTFPACIPLMREAMTALSRGETIQPLRSILRMDDARMFGIMPGAMSGRGAFGAKLVSVFPGNADRGLQSHQGGILLFDPETGAPSALVHAGEVTALRTAAASAAATDALALPRARRLAVLGYGEQAESHVEAIAQVRALSSVAVWGRSKDKTWTFARRMAERTRLHIRPCATAREAVEGADIVCTVTASPEPILKGAWLAPGAHVNLVGSSYAGPVEADHEIVTRSRFIADHREGVLAQGAEFLKAKEAGLVGDDHVAGEIGQVHDGVIEGRTSDDQITVYKSLGHVAQDLACARWLAARANAAGVTPAAF
jgi:ornithine cyclodeaminase/alanine dehydrogenase-like protein (mu-crystallin family)